MPLEFTIHLLPLDLPPQALDAMATLLSPEEQQRAQRFAFEKLRQRFIAAHGNLRRILGALTEEEPEQIAISAEPWGKPFLPHHPQLSFSLSHSGDLAVLAIVRASGVGPRLGVDVEELREGRDFPGVSKRFLSPEERASLPAAQSQEFSRSFLSLWTRKEALTKCLGTGLRTPFHTFSVPTGALPQPQTAHWNDGNATSHLYVGELALPAAYRRYVGAWCLELSSQPLPTAVIIPPTAQAT